MNLGTNNFTVYPPSLFMAVMDTRGWLLVRGATNTMMIKTIKEKSYIQSNHDFGELVVKDWKSISLDADNIGFRGTPPLPMPSCTTVEECVTALDKIGLINYTGND